MTDAPRTLYDKIWDAHVVHEAEDGTCLLYIDRHLVHEVTSPQAFEGLREAGRPLWRNAANLLVADHNVPTTDRRDGIADPTSRLQVETLDANAKSYGLTYFNMNDKRQGIVHVIGPEQGATLPGMTVVCGDSHTSTHGAFGCLAHGIGFGERADIEHDGSLFLWCDTNKDAPSAAQVQVMRQNNCGSELAREGGGSVNTVLDDAPISRAGSLPQGNSVVPEGFYQPR